MKILDIIYEDPDSENLILQAVKELQKIVMHLINSGVHTTPRGSSELKMSVKAVADAWDVDQHELFKAFQKEMWEKYGTVIVLPSDKDEHRLAGEYGL